MARINIDIGTLGNPATGDTLRTAMSKINTNFTEVYSLVRDGSSGLIATDVTNGDLKLQANGTGSIEIDTLSIQNSTITSITTNSDITLTPNGTGNVVLGNFTFNADQTVGAGQDNYVFTYDHSTGTIGLEASAAGDVTASSTTTFTNKTFDANGTGNSISNIDIADFTSGVFLDEDNMASNSATAIASQQSIKAYVDSQILTKDNTDEITEGSTNLYFTNARADARITNALKDEDNMASDSATHVPSQQSVKAYVDAEDANIASDSMTFTNKAGNISQWTNDSNYATQAYVDARDIGDLAVTGSTISAPSNADLTLTTSGTGSVSVDGIQIKGTELSSTDSTQITIKENLHVTGNISGTITGTVSTLDADNTTVSNIEVDNFKASAIITVAETLASNDSDTALVTAGAIIDYVDAQDANIASDTLTLTNKTFDVEGTGNSISNIDVADFKAAAIVTAGEGIGSNNNDTTIPTSAAVKAYADSVGGGSTGDLAITGSTISAPSNADLTLTTSGTGSVSVDAIQIKGTEISSTDSTQVTIKENLNVTGTITGDGTGITNVETIAVDDESSDTTCFPLFSTGATSLSSGLPVKTDQSAYKYNASTGSLQANSFVTSGIEVAGNKVTTTASNADLELDASGTGGIVAQAPMTFNAGYIEKINALTSSSTITVNCALASIHTVTLATATEFNITNLPTGGSVTLIITQDGTGSRTATYGTDGSSAVKFPSNSSTLSTGAGDIDVVTIINDGTNFLGNIAKDYRSS